MVVGVMAPWRWVIHLWRFARTTVSSNREIPPEPFAAVGHDRREQIRQFEAFYWQYEHQIIIYLRRMLGDEQAAYDLSQETFLRAWQHFAAIQTRTTARAWLYRVATNLALTHLQQHAIRPQLALDVTVPDPHDVAHDLGEHDLIQQVLQRLTAKQRSVLLLHEVHGLSCDEMGALLRMSRSAIKGALWRAREAFRREYGREGAEG